MPASFFGPFVKRKERGIIPTTGQDERRILNRVALPIQLDDLLKRRK